MSIYWKSRIEAIEEKNAKQENGDVYCKMCGKKTHFVPRSSPSGSIICTKCYHNIKIK